VKPWVNLYRAHTAFRKDGLVAVTSIRRVLREMGEQSPSVFDKHVHQRLQPKKNQKNGLRILQLGLGGRESFDLSGAGLGGHGVVEASLTVQMLLDRSTGHLHSLTLMVEAKKLDGAPWAIAVHLSDDRGNSGDHDGHGACGHAALHCHVGPTLDDKPNVRVPLPSVDAGELVGWLVSQVVPALGFERAPWPEVAAALKPAGS